MSLILYLYCPSLTISSPHLFISLHLVCLFFSLCPLHPPPLTPVCFLHPPLPLGTLTHPLIPLLTCLRLPQLTPAQVSVPVYLMLWSCVWVVLLDLLCSMTVQLSSSLTHRPCFIPHRSNFSGSLSTSPGSWEWTELGSEYGSVLDQAAVG